MTRWLAALTGIMTLLLLAFSSFLTALLLLTTILLMMPTLLLLGPFQFLFFLSVHLKLPRTLGVHNKGARQAQRAPALPSTRWQCGRH